MQSLLKHYSNLVIIDVETTGLDPETCNAIEIAALLVRTHREGGIRVIKCLDTLVKLPVEKKMPKEIVKLTGITAKVLKDRGVAQQEAATALAHVMHTESALFVGYNVHFDLLFIKELLKKEGHALPKGLVMLDVLEVFRDRRGYPCKLGDAISAYDLVGKVQNAHRAAGDAVACLEVLRAMGRERDDLDIYVKTFGGGFERSDGQHQSG